MGFTSGFTIPPDDEQLPEIDVTCFGIEEADDILLELIEQHVPWSKAESIVFFCNEHRFSEVISDFLQKKNIGHHSHHSFHMMQLDQVAFEEKNKSNAPALPAGHSLGL